MRHSQSAFPAVGQAPRLIHLADYGGSYSGSFIPMLARVARTSMERGWSVELVFAEDAEGRGWLRSLKQAGVPYRFIDVGSRARAGRWAAWFVEELTAGRRQTPLTREIRALLDESSAPTIVHTHFSSFDVPAAHAARNVSNAVVVWHRHGMRRPGWAPFVAGFVNYRVFARDVAQVICVGPHLAKDVRRFAGAKRVSFVPNGIDAQRFKPASPAEREQARLSLGLPSEAKVLLHFGWYWHLKGGDLYLAAVESLLETQTTSLLRGITIGREDAHAAVDAAGVRSHVSVLEPREAVRDLYAAADVLVSPSRFEGVPLAVCEALAMGLPVVASDIPGHAYVGKALEACRLAELDPLPLAASIAEVLKLEPETRRREQEAARDWIRNHVGLEHWSETLMKTYERLLSERLGVEEYRSPRDGSLSAAASEGRSGRPG
jgi:glycosyltransferase involved in cell wall biosynthesis